MVWQYPQVFDLIVIGAGHAGCEAACAGAQMGGQTLLLTMNLDTVAKMSCNPAIGGTAKGQMVREIDALGGQMAKLIDRTGIQFRMLNRSKGPAVWAPRAQADKTLYQYEMKHILEKTPHLFLKQGTIEKLLVSSGKITGVTTLEGIQYNGKSVIICSGTFMRGLIHIGQNHYPGGRVGDKPSVGLSASLTELGFHLGRFKTGTPPRINGKSIDYSQLEEQTGETDILFSFDEQPIPKLPQISCYITYTNLTTQKIIQDNLHRSALYSGIIKGEGPRYCPSIEDKMVRFKDKQRHQLFLEPEGLSTEEVYVNGISTSLPYDVQLEAIRSIEGLEKAEIMRPAYAIEYDYAISGQIYPTLETKTIEGLYFAGQINGTSGYEEAAAQGLVAGINAIAKVQGKPAFIPSRAESYIGVMIDDLTTKGVDEPYRMFTSRAEHRLHLRQDNADMRLRKYGYAYGLISQLQYDRLQKKLDAISSEMTRMPTSYVTVDQKSTPLAQLLKRPDYSYDELLNQFPSVVSDYGKETNLQIELTFKYAGYLERQMQEIEKFSKLDSFSIPENFNYTHVLGLRNEAKEKLKKMTPQNLGQASRIPGVSPADISVLMVMLRSQQNTCSP